MKSKKLLLKVMLIYALIFAVIGAIIIGVFYLFLSDYEKSRPAVIVKNYIDNISDASLDVLVKDSAQQLNFGIMPEKECYAELRNSVHDAKSVLDPTVSNDDKQVYVLRAEGKTLGRLVLVPEKKTLFGFNKYEVTPTEFDLSGLMSEQEITVPADYTVTVGGTALSEDNIIEKNAHYALLEEFYDDTFISVPGMYVYNTGKYLGEPEIVITDGNGNIVDEMDEEKACDNCTDEQKELLKTTAGNFVQAYVNYSSTAFNLYGNYDYLESLMVVGSPLQQRMRSAMSGLGWSVGSGDTLQEIEYHRFMDLGDGMYYCDLTYNNLSSGFAGKVTTVNNLKLIFVETDGRLLAAAMSSY